jgi:hypothetical protein
MLTKRLPTKKQFLAFSLMTFLLISMVLPLNGKWHTLLRNDKVASSPAYTPGG